MNLKEWAREQGVSYTTARRWFASGKLPVSARKVGGLILVDAEEAPWVVAMECACGDDPVGSVERVHYLIGPFLTRSRAEEAARSWPMRRTHVFQLWAPRVFSERHGP